MAPVYIGLIHYPIYNKHMKVVTTALTNYDLHDIARTARTYDVKKYFIVHPVQAQRDMALRIMNHWKTGAGSQYNANRKEAFKETELVPDLQSAIHMIEEECGKKPAIVTTDALQFLINRRPIRIRQYTQITPHAMRGYDSADGY